MKPLRGTPFSAVWLSVHGLLNVPWCHVVDHPALLKHNPSAQEPRVLEAITVQRDPLISVLVESALDTGAGLRHHLLIGPRGMGKTHLLSLVASRIRDQADPNHLTIAQLREDPWAIRTYEKFLGAVLEQVGAELKNEELSRLAEEVRSGEAADALAAEEGLRGGNWDTAPGFGGRESRRDFSPDR